MFGPTPTGQTHPEPQLSGSKRTNYGSIVGDEPIYSDKMISPTRHFLMVTLAYPMLTVATPLTTLFLLYVLFDCLDREMCFKPHPVTPVNATAPDADAPSATLTAPFGDEELRLICLISLLFVTLLVGTLLILKVKRDDRGIPDAIDGLKEPLLRHV